MAKRLTTQDKIKRLRSEGYSLYSLARARVAEWALLCDPSTIVKINGDAIYSTVAQPELDKLDTGRNGQPRRKS